MMYCVHHFMFSFDQTPYMHIPGKHHTAERANSVSIVRLFIWRHKAACREQFTSEHESQAVGLEIISRFNSRYMLSAEEPGKLHIPHCLCQLTSMCGSCMQLMCVWCTHPRMDQQLPTLMASLKSMRICAMDIWTLSKYLYRHCS